MINICWIGLYLPGEMPERKELEAAVRLNPDGAGWALVTPDRQMFIKRQLNAGVAAIETFLEARERCPYSIAVFHARHAGSMPVSLENVHPFHVGADPDTVVFHNGYLFPAGENGRSDSVVFAEEILPLYDLRNRDDHKLLEARMGKNKAVVLSVRPGASPAVILNPGLGKWVPGGGWRSNDDHTGVSHLQPGRCAACGVTISDGKLCATCDQAAEDRRAVLLQGPGVEDVDFCGCTNEELEADRTCGEPQCPNLPREEER